LKIKHGESSADDSRSQIAEPLMGRDKNFMIDENDNIEDMIDIITKKTVPVKKLGKKPASKKIQNLPPKRFKPEDQLFIQGQFNEVQQQKKLQKIAESIGGFASQVAAN
jgi:hypothetical protein